jgi:single-stranded-DNA-specific exonuclease
VDHHEILDKVPRAEIVVDPKQKGDKSAKNLANVGIAFKLVEVLLGDNMTDNLRKNFLELVALGTIADMMPKVDENEVFITEGLRNLEMTWRPGLRAFFEIPLIENIPAVGQKVARIISVLNVRDVQDRRPASFRLLTMKSVEDSKELIKKFLEKHNLRREIAEKICAEIENRISGKGKIIFEGDTSWDYTVISTVASVLSQKYKKLTFIYKKLQSESQGTVRSIKGIDSVALMKSCKKLLITYGGHPMAAGFRIKNENLEKFKQCLIKNLKTQTHA